MNKLNKKTPIIFYVALSVLCVTLVSFSLTGGLFAKYTSSVSGSDSARVAKYDVSVSEISPIALNSYDPDALVSECLFTVTSNSEVSIRYDIVVDFGMALPDFVSFKIDGRTGAADTANTEFTFEDMGEFILGAEGYTGKKTHTLTFEVEPAHHEDGNVLLENVALRIVAEQID